MTITPSEFNDKLNVLTKICNGEVSAWKSLQDDSGPPDINKLNLVAFRALSDCVDFLLKEEDSIYEALQKEQPDGIKNIAYLEKRYSVLAANVSEIERIYKSKWGREVQMSQDESTPMWMVFEQSKKLEKILEPIETIKALRKIDEDFAKEWSALSEKERELTIQRLFFCPEIEFSKAFNETRDNTLRLSGRQSMLKLLTTHLKLIPESNATQPFYFLWPLADNFKDSPARSVDYMNQCFAVIAQVHPGFREETFQKLKSINRKNLSLNELFKTLEDVRNFCASKHFHPKWIDTENLSLLPLMTSDFESFERLSQLNTRRDINIHNLMEHIGAYTQHAKSGIKPILEIFNNLLPDAAIALNAIFAYGKNLTPSQLIKLEKLVVWINEQIKSDPSSKNKISGILDRMAALFIDNPFIAESLLKLPKEKLWLLDKIFHDRSDILALTFEDIKSALQREGEVTLSSSLFDTTSPFVEDFEKFAGENLPINFEIHKWLDATLQMQTPPVAVNSNMTIKEKMQKLPLQYMQVAEKILKLSQNDSRGLLILLKFAANHPYLGTLNHFIDNLDTSKATLNSITTFYLLSVQFPYQLHQILKLNKTGQKAVLDLAEKNKILAEHLLERHVDVILTSGRMETILNDAEMQKGLLVLMDIEVNTGSNLANLFKSELNKLKSQPFMNAISNDQAFALALANILTGFTSWETFLAAFNKFPQDTIQIVKTLKNFRKTLEKQLEAKVEGKSFDILTLEKSKYPNDMVRLAELIESNHTDLAEELLELFKTDTTLAHRLLDMATGNYIPEAKDLLNLKRTKPTDTLTKKLLEIAGSKHAPLISKILNLDSRKDEALLKLFSKSHVDLTAPIIKQVLVVHGRRSLNLLNDLIRIYSLLPNQRSTLDQAILQAVTEGRFNLCQELSATHGKPFIRQGSAILPMASLQKWTDIYNDWMAFDKSKLSSLDRVLIERELIPFATKFAQDSSYSKSYCTWGSKVQFLLQHNPQKLIDILNTKDWQKVDQGITWDITWVVEVFLDALTKDSTNLSASVSLTQLSTALAKCLVTPSGTINADLITVLENHPVDILKNHPAIARFNSDPYAKAYLQRVLTTLKTHPEFSEQLSALQLVPFPSRQHEIIAKMLGLPSDKPMRAREGKIAAISVLLWPLRQGEAGSCFATSSVIQMAGNPDGLKQILEDAISLIEKGCVKRKSSGAQGSVEYPLVMGDAAATTKFAKDNLLARTLEFSLASMGAKNSGLKKGALELWEGLFLAELAYAFELESAIQRKEDITNEKVLKKARVKGDSAIPGLLDDKPLLKSMHAELIAELSRSCGLIFNGFATHPFTSTSGAWQLIDNESGDPFEDPKVLAKFYAKILAKTEKALLIRHPQDTTFIKQLFSVSLPNYVNSQLFIQKFFNSRTEASSQSKDKGLTLVNPAKYNYLRSITPLADYGTGGHTCVFLSALHETNVRSRTALPYPNPFETIFHHTRFLTDNEQEQAQGNLNFYLPARSAGHAYNFKAGEALALFDKANPTVVWERHLKQTAELESMQLTAGIQSGIISNFFNYFKPEERSQLQFALNQKIPLCKTIKDLCRALNQAYLDVFGADDNLAVIGDRLEAAIRAIPELKAKCPQIVPVFDTNWDLATEFGYGKRLLDGSVTRAFPDKENQVFLSTWNPGNVNEIEHFTYRDSTKKL